jgi:membrane protein implicated in regulation of membrane protease activity
LPSRTVGFVIADGLLDLGIDLDVWPWVWLGLAVVFALVELTFIGGTFVLLPFAISAFAAAILAFYDVAIEIQWLTFVVGGGLVLFIMLRWVRGFLDENVLPRGVGADRLVGTLGIVTVAIEPGDSARPGRVSVEGELWGALSSDDQRLPIGTRVRITSVIGTRAVVEALTPPEPDATDEQGGLP